MTAIAPERRQAPGTGWNWARERLITLSAAAKRLGWDVSTVRDWANDEGSAIPVVRTPGGHLSVYESWLTAVLASARPGQHGDMGTATRQWWAERGELEEAA